MPKQTYTVMEAQRHMETHALMYTVIDAQICIYTDTHTRLSAIHGHSHPYVTGTHTETHPRHTGTDTLRHITHLIQDTHIRTQMYSPLDSHTHTHTPTTRAK